MCYHKSFKSEVEELYRYMPHMDYKKYEQGKLTFEPSAHFADYMHSNYPVIYFDKEINRHTLTFMEWGIIPHYIQNEKEYEKKRLSMTNIRSERILDDKSSYWNSIQHNRCLIPMNGFYEYREIKGWEHKVPYYIHIPSQPIFFIPGLYSVAYLPDEKKQWHRRYTFAPITRAANSVMRLIHNSGEYPHRMLSMMPFAQSKAWLNKKMAEEEYRSFLNYELPSHQLSHHTVYSLQTGEGRPDGLESDAFYLWNNLPDLGNDMALSTSLFRA